MFSNLTKICKTKRRLRLLGLIRKCSGGDLIHMCVVFLVCCTFFWSTCCWVLLEAQGRMTDTVWVQLGPFVAWKACNFCHGDFASWNSLCWFWPTPVLSMTGLLLLCHLLIQIKWPRRLIHVKKIFAVVRLIFWVWKILMVCFLSFLLTFMSSQSLRY